MTTTNWRLFFVFTLGVVLGAGAMLLKPGEPVRAAAANSNDKFSMTTVPVTNTFGDTEVVFILDHLTGLLRGGLISIQTGKFTFIYEHNVAVDFNLNPATPEPKYSIVGGPANLRSSGGVTPANGLLYVAELTSGTVVAYGLAAPRGQGAKGVIPLVPVDAFPFREASR
ncbi:MAG: hypothetical protein R3C59_29675 [Planctomycetaceae bacterium]